MRKVILYIAASMDGKIARKDDSIDWLPDIDGEDYGYEPFYDSIDTLLMGYKTYEVCVGFPEWHYAGKKVLVFSRNPEKTVVPQAELLTEDVAETIRRLKAEPGKDIWLVGGGELVRQAHDAGLIDEYIVTLIPIILGEGVELFPAIHREQALTLVKQKAYASGCVMLYFEPKS